MRTTASGHKFVTHPAPERASGTLKPDKWKAGRRGRGLPAGRFPKHATLAASSQCAEPASSTGSRHQPGTKVCRKCAQALPLTDFFVDKRIEEGFMHYCAPCAHKNGLSGRLATAAELVAAQKAPALSKTTSAQPKGTLKTAADFYSQGSSPRSRPAGLLAMKAGGRHAKRGRAQTDLDVYENDFVDDDTQEELEDWRKELQSVWSICMSATSKHCKRGSESLASARTLNTP
jgi:hypothetical protein